MCEELTIDTANRIIRPCPNAHASLSFSEFGADFLSWSESTAEGIFANDFLSARLIAAKSESMSSR